MKGQTVGYIRVSTEDQNTVRIPLMPTDGSEVKPTGIPLGSRPVFRCDADRLLMRWRGVKVTVS